MPRQTRAAKRAQEDAAVLDVDATGTLNKDTEALNESREPLAEKTANGSLTPDAELNDGTVPEQTETTCEETTATQDIKGKRGKGGKKGRGKKQDVKPVVVEVEAEPELAEPEVRDVELEAAQEGKSGEAPAPVPEPEEKPTRSTRATRSRKVATVQEEEPQANLDALAALEGKTELPTTRPTRVTRRGQPKVEEQTDNSTKEEAVSEEPPRLLLPAIELTEAPTDDEEEEPKTASPLSPLSPSKPVVHAEDSFEAIDALEDALENVGRFLPDLESSPEKPRRRSPGKRNPSPAKTPGTKSKKSSRSSVNFADEVVIATRPPRYVEKEKVLVPAKSALKYPSTAGEGPKLKKKAQISTARPSVAPAPAPAVRPRQLPSKISRPTPSSNSRPSTIAAKPATGLSRSASLQTRPTTKPATTATNNKQDYLTARRAARPVSVSFPTPPPPPRSTKPATKPTFSLPGEAVAARLKAQREAREERMRQRAEDEALEKEKREKEAQLRKRSSLTMSNNSTNTNARNFSQPKPRPISMPPTAFPNTIGSSSLHIPPARTSSKPMTANTAAKRVVSGEAKVSGPGVTIAPLNAPPPPPKSAPVMKSTVTAADLAAQRQRARLMVQRERNEGSAFQNDKRAKEEAQRKARAEAAERGRIASREWAEKMMAKRTVSGPAAIAAKKEGKENISAA